MWLKHCWQAFNPGVLQTKIRPSMIISVVWSYKLHGGIQVGPQLDKARRNVYNIMEPYRRCVVTPFDSEIRNRWNAGLLPPAYIVRREVIFSVCLSTGGMPPGQGVSSAPPRLRPLDRAGVTPLDRTRETLLIPPHFPWTGQRGTPLPDRLSP